MPLRPNSERADLRENRVAMLQHFMAVASRTTHTLVCLLFVAAATWASYSVLHVNSLIAGFLYVLLVLLVAAKWGLTESIVTSVASTLCLNYFFLPPILSFTIADPQNWVALFVFLVTAITASKLSSLARQRANDAQTRRIEVERLYQLSRSLMLVATTRDLGIQIARLVKEHFAFVALAYCDGLSGEISVTTPDCRFEEQQLRDIAIATAFWFVWRKELGQGTELIVAPVMLGERIVGSLAAIGNPVSEPVWQAIANLVGIAIERARQQEITNRLEAARHNEHLRSTLLDALAHDFSTPLTSIKGAVTTARSHYAHEPEEEDLLAVVEEEVNKLSGMVDETVDLARVEPGRAHIRPREVSIPNLIQVSLNRLRSLLDGRPIAVQVQEGMSALQADPDLLGLALRQLLSNAVKYSPPGSTITIAAAQAKNMITVRVEDEGPGIPPSELGAIFERFYRGTITRDLVVGTGVGLSVTRDIVNAHHGKLWAENRPEGGAKFSLSVPIA